MSKEIVYWELKFDSMFFGGVDFCHNGTRYANREDAVQAVKDLSEYLCKNYLSNMERKVIHEKHTDRVSNAFDDRFWYRLVVVDCHDYSQIVSFGCERKVLRLK